MTIENVQPSQCHARARTLLAEVEAIRDALGRSPDGRPALEITDAKPRECYFEALATWHKADRLAAELGVASARFAHAAPALTDTLPGHVLQVIDEVLARVRAIGARLEISQQAPDATIEPNRQPSDVFATLVRVNRELSRALERPFTPSDVYRVVSLACAYATRLGGTAPLAPFEHKRKPVDCYQRLVACQQLLAGAISKRGQTALAARGVPTDVLPGDVYDVATLVLGEIAFLHALTPGAAAVYPFEPEATGHRLPAHVDQLARTLEAQLAAIR